MYDHRRQYRCYIIRSRSQNEMDNLLPLYANIIDTICPCKRSEFVKAFNDAFCSNNSSMPSKKTLDNHRTEIVGQLFGMYYTSEDGFVYSSERTKKFISDSDTPAFFKDVCYKMQFPNGGQKIQTVKESVANNINIRQFPFLLKVMMVAKSNNITLSKKEIGYYVLNSLDVLQGKASPQEVVDAIAADRKSGVERDIKTRSNDLSYDWHHIYDQINLLELANLVIIEGTSVILNPREENTIDLFAKRYEDKPKFDVYSYDIGNKNIRKRFKLDWGNYFACLSEEFKCFETSAESLGVRLETPAALKSEEGTHTSTVEIGDEGEKYVYEYEKRRVEEYNFRLAGKVIHLGKTRGLGYDIQSVVATPGDNAEFVKYIEVKATKRVTAPDIGDKSWIDTINMTRNEWVAAQQHRDYYSIFRVYFVRDSVIMFVLKNIAGKQDDGILQAVPMSYRIDFGSFAVDEAIHRKGGKDEYV